MNDLLERKARELFLEVARLQAVEDKNPEDVFPVITQALRDVAKECAEIAKNQAKYFDTTLGKRDNCLKIAKAIEERFLK